MRPNSEEDKCNIRQAGDTFFAITGITFSSVYSFAETACRDGESYAEKAERFEDLVTQPLADELEKIRQRSPASFEARFAGRPCLQIVIFGIEYGTPAYVLINFIASNSPTDPVHLDYRLSTCPGDSPITQSTTLVLGCEIPSVLILGYEFPAWVFASDENSWDREDIVEGVKRRIASEKLASAISLGSGHNQELATGMKTDEVDIIRIRPNRAEWVYHRQVCAEIEPYKLPETRPPAAWSDLPRRHGFFVGALIAYWPAVIAALIGGLVIVLLIVYSIRKRAGTTAEPES